MSAPVIATRLRDLAVEYDAESGRHNLNPDSSRFSILQAAATLRLIAVMVDEGAYSITDGYVWLHAGRRILTATQKQRIHA